MRFLLRVVINAIAIWLATELLGGLHVVGELGSFGRLGVFVVLGALFGVINAVLKPIIKVVAFPIYLLTLGLFTLVVNGALLWLVYKLTEDLDWGLRIDSFGAAVAGAIIVSIVSFVLSLVTRANKR